VLWGSPGDMMLPSGSFTDSTNDIPEDGSRLERIRRTFVIPCHCRTASNL
jgi:hypothetical protein